MPMTTTQCILRYAHWLEEISPGFLATVILTETGEDYAHRDLLDQVARLIELFGVAGVADIVGCETAAADGGAAMSRRS
jgi:hypothetical protein